MHYLSFESNNCRFSFEGLKFSFQVFTFQNLYELNPTYTSVVNKGSSCIITSTGYTWANGQQKCSGELSALIEKKDNRFFIKINAVHHSEKIRSVKCIIYDRPWGKIANLRLPERENYPRDIDRGGEVFTYPNGFEGLYTPLIVLQDSNGKYSWYRSEDVEVRPKTFAVIPDGEQCAVEMIFEECARKFSNTVSVPVWEVGFDSAYDTIMQSQAEWISSNYRLKKWEDREDVPNWAKKISLILSIHCEHWTGYAFNTYDDICKIIEKISNEIDMYRVLLYLPGWEGRYYYQYGDMRPEPRLGGEEGFKKMIETAHRYGAHVMPMFMINGANPHTEDFDLWGTSSLYIKPSGFPQVWGSCDWDTSRHYDHNCGFPLNPGAPLWQDHLVNQVNSLLDKYQFDGVFMDLAAVYNNDKRFDTYQGIVDIANRIRQNHPDVLMAGEGWYDALSVAYPLTQPSMNNYGDTRWSDRPYAPLFDRSNRAFAHLGTGDLSRGSTGVFEFGYNFMTMKTPLRKGIIPTLTIVDTTINDAWDKVLGIIEQAKKYAQLYL